MKNLLFVILLALVGAQICAAEAPPQLLLGWGSQGSAPGQGWPWAVATNNQGDVYIADMDNNRIQWFTSDGMFLGQWGSLGSGNGQFYGPTDLAIDQDGNVYVIDGSNYRIQKFTGTGVFLTKWGSQGTNPGQFTYPFSIALSPQGNVYVLDNQDSKVVIFSSEGVFLAQWRTDLSGAVVEVAPDGNVWVSAGSQILIYNPDGTRVDRWVLPMLGVSTPSPMHVAFKNDGSLYLADANYRIIKYSADREVLTYWSPAGGWPWNPRGICLNADSDIYITTGYQVLKYGEAPVPITPTSWGEIKALNHKP